MEKKINTLAEANGMLLEAIIKAEKDLAKGSRGSGRDEAVVAKASERDRRKFIPRRMS